MGVENNLYFITFYNYEAFLKAQQVNVYFLDVQNSCKKKRHIHAHETIVCCH